ncbi:serine/threonine-protein phosphatase [Bifidobacterium sp. ESL0784]|uniref:PP2C family protein-serine/threonine phosphatase n=1 Tax=Bifidobacterium sp. ESL0784 TaxID=2983231 RepID=UPI0023F79D70|nr:serine/threonine-protein phosphatase [Bifidobacterium sp. ESL0784]MDF7640385.1 serine/threonine-protein phosphatase [Bifidobacterium sp. ESL0784]
MSEHPHIRAAMGSDIGRKRRNNQDSGVNESGVYMVCDGMGGGVGGERASALTAEHFKAIAGEPIRSRQIIESALDTAQDDVYELGQDLGGVAGTTATGIILPARPGEDGNEQAPLWYVINVGDSRTYHFDLDARGNAIASSISHVTKDHSQRQQAIDAGLMSPQMANATIPRNVITQCIGAPQGVRPDFYAVVPSGRFVVCSDGLYSEVPDAQIAAICQANPDPERAMEALVKAALAAGGKDNITVIVVDVWPDRPYDEPWHASKLDDGEELETIGDITLDSLHT